MEQPGSIESRAGCLGLPQCPEGEVTAPRLSQSASLMPTSEGTCRGHSPLSLVAVTERKAVAHRFPVSASKEENVQRQRAADAFEKRILTEGEQLIGPVTSAPGPLALCSLCGRSLGPGVEAVLHALLHERRTNKRCDLNELFHAMGMSQLRQCCRGSILNTRRLEMLSWSIKAPEEDPTKRRGRFFRVFKKHPLDPITTAWQIKNGFDSRADQDMKEALRILQREDISTRCVPGKKGLEITATIRVTHIGPPYTSIDGSTMSHLFGSLRLSFYPGEDKTGSQREVKLDSTILLGRVNIADATSAPLVYGRSANLKHRKADHTNVPIVRRQQNLLVCSFRSVLPHRHRNAEVTFRLAMRDGGSCILVHSREDKWEPVGAWLRWIQAQKTPPEDVGAALKKSYEEHLNTQGSRIGCCHGFEALIPYLRRERGHVLDQDAAPDEATDESGPDEAMDDVANQAEPQAAPTSPISAAAVLHEDGKDTGKNEAILAEARAEAKKWRLLEEALPGPADPMQTLAWMMHQLYLTHVGQERASERNELKGFGDRSLVWRREVHHSLNSALETALQKSIKTPFSPDIKGEGEGLGPRGPVGGTTDAALDEVSGELMKGEHPICKLVLLERRQAATGVSRCSACGHQRSLAYLHGQCSMCLLQPPVPEQPWLASLTLRTNMPPLKTCEPRELALNVAANLSLLAADANHKRQHLAGILTGAGTKRASASEWREGWREPVRQRLGTGPGFAASRSRASISVLGASVGDTSLADDVKPGSRIFFRNSEKLSCTVEEKLMKAIRRLLGAALLDKESQEKKATKEGESASLFRVEAGTTSKGWSLLAMASGELVGWYRTERVHEVLICVREVLRAAASDMKRIEVCLVAVQFIQDRGPPRIIVGRGSVLLEAFQAKPLPKDKVMDWTQLLLQGYVQYVQRTPFLTIKDRIAFEKEYQKDHPDAQFFGGLSTELYKFPKTLQGLFQQGEVHPSRKYYVHKGVLVAAAEQPLHFQGDAGQDPALTCILGTEECSIHGNPRGLLMPHEAGQPFMLRVALSPGGVTREDAMPWSPEVMTNFLLGHLRTLTLDMDCTLEAVRPAALRAFIESEFRKLRGGGSDRPHGWLDSWEAVWGGLDVSNDVCKGLPRLASDANREAQFFCAHSALLVAVKQKKIVWAPEDGWLLDIEKSQLPSCGRAAGVRYCMLFLSHSPMSEGNKILASAQKMTAYFLRIAAELGVHGALAACSVSSRVAAQNLKDGWLLGQRLAEGVVEFSRPGEDGNPSPWGFWSEYGEGRAPMSSYINRAMQNPETPLSGRQRVSFWGGARIDMETTYLPCTHAKQVSNSCTRGGDQPGRFDAIACDLMASKNIRVTHQSVAAVCRACHAFGGACGCDPAVGTLPVALGESSIRALRGAILSGLTVHLHPSTPSRSSST